MAQLPPNPEVDLDKNIEGAGVGKNYYSFPYNQFSHEILQAHNFATEPGYKPNPTIKILHLKENSIINTS